MKTRITDDIPGLSEEAVRLDGPEFDGGIVGTYEADDGTVCLVYGYFKLCESLQAAWGIPMEDVMEMVDYNTVRSVPYMGKYRPIIIKEL